MSAEVRRPAEPSGERPEPVAGPDLAHDALARARAARRTAAPTEAERIEAAGKRAGVRRERKRRPKADPMAFGEAIEAFLAARGWQADLKTHSVLARWDAIAGPEIAARCRPESLRDGELTLVAESTAWATQLRLLAGSIRQRLDEELGPGVVTRIRVHGPAGSRPGGASGQWRVRGGRGPRDTYG